MAAVKKARKLAGRSEAEALQAARQWADDEGMKHSVSPVKCGELGWYYVYFMTGPLEDPALKIRRETLINAGYEPVNGPLYDGEGERPEYVAGQPLAELWRCTDRVAKLHFKRRLDRAMADDTWRLMQANRMRPQSFFTAPIPADVPGDNDH